MNETMTVKRRVRVDYDAWCPAPDYDAHVPVLRVTRHHGWEDVYLSLEPMIGAKYLENVDVYLDVDSNDVFAAAERYLRTLGPTRLINAQGDAYFLVATPEWREAMGCEDLEPIRAEVEGGRPTDFEYWLRDETYRLTLEELHPTKDLVTGEVTDVWVEVDALGGVYGWEYAHSLETARDAFGLDENEDVEVFE